jgi:hypothetical protein
MPVSVRIEHGSTTIESTRNEPLDGAAAMSP